MYVVIFTAHVLIIRVAGSEWSDAAPLLCGGSEDQQAPNGESTGEPQYLPSAICHCALACYLWFVYWVWHTVKYGELYGLFYPLLHPHNLHVQALECADAITKVLQLLPETEVSVQVSDAWSTSTCAVHNQLHLPTGSISATYSTLPQPLWSTLPPGISTEARSQLP